MGCFFRETDLIEEPRLLRLDIHGYDMLRASLALFRYYIYIYIHIPSISFTRM